MQLIVRDFSAFIRHDICRSTVFSVGDTIDIVTDVTWHQIIQTIYFIVSFFIYLKAANVTYFFFLTETIPLCINKFV